MNPSIASRILLPLGGGLVVASLLLAGTDLYLRDKANREVLHTELQRTVEERARTESELFLQATRRLKQVRDDALARTEWQSTASATARWEQMIQRETDGTFRTSPEFQSRTGTLVHVAANTSLAPGLQHRIVATRDTTHMFGESWRREFQDLWFVGSERWLVRYAASEADLPVYPSDYDPTLDEGFIAASPAKNPERSAIIGNPLAGLKKEPVVTMSLPVYKGTHFIGVVGHSINLDRLFRLVRSETLGKLVVIRTDGQVIAVTGIEAEPKQGSENFSIANSDGVGEIAKTITGLTLPSGNFVTAQGTQIYFARMADVPWYLILIQEPRRIFSSLGLAQILMALGMSAVIALILIFSINRVRRLIREPVEHFSATVRQLISGQAGVMLPAAASTEMTGMLTALGELQNHLVTTHEQIQSAERAKATGQEELFQLRQRNTELEQKLAVVDSRWEVLKQQVPVLEQKIEELSGNLQAALERGKRAESRLQQWLDNLPIAAIIFTEDQRIRYGNAAAVHLLGSSMAQLLETSMDPLVANDTQSFADLMTNADEHGMAGDERLAVTGLTGRPLVTRATIMRTQYQGQKSFLTLLIDQTGQDAAERELRELKSRIAAIYEIAPITFFEFIREGGNQRFTYVGPGVDDLMGVTQQQLYEDVNHMFSVAHPEDTGSLVQSIDAATSRLERFKVRYRIILRTKAFRTLVMVAVPLESNERSSHWFGYFTEADPVADTGTSPGLPQPTVTNAEASVIEQTSTPEPLSPDKEISVTVGNIETSDQARREFDRPAAARICDELEKLLKEYDATSEDVMIKHQTILQVALDAHFEVIQGAIRNFDFDLATNEILNARANGGF
jgi:PAS domain S-box-containing protein